MEPVVSSILSVTTRGLCTFRKVSELADQVFFSGMLDMQIDSDGLSAENQAVSSGLDIA